MEEDTTKYGEFISSYFAWLTLEGQKENAKKLENMTKKPFPDIEISYFAIHIERVKSVDE